MYQHHIVYETRNRVNGKLYVGFHSTDRINDGYLGSGWALKAALKKYGRDAFERRVLSIHKTRKDARAAEACIVTDEFCKRADTYNLVPGGMGVEDQSGAKNHMFGKIAHNAKPVRALHKDGRVVNADSIGKLAEIIGVARPNVRALLNSGRRGWRGWLVVPAT
jgi:hypothetical protein